MSLVSGGAVNPTSMADPANVSAAPSTSRRKRVLPPQQPRIEAKRRRVGSQEDRTADTRHKQSLKVGYFY